VLYVTVKIINNNDWGQPTYF